MIIDFIQTERQPHPQYNFTDLNGVLLAKGDVPSSDKPIILWDGAQVQMDLNTKKKVMKSGKRSVVDVTINGEVYAEIFQAAVVTKKVLFIPIGYGYTSIVVDETEYQCYEVGFGVDQHYFCVLRDGETVAMIHKADIVKNHRDTYRIYTDETMPMLALFSLAMYIDCTMYADIGDVVGVGTENQPYYSAQPELREKYDSSFIPKIKAMNGITD